MSYFGVDLDLDGREIKRATFEQLLDFPPHPFAGQLVQVTINGKPRVAYYDGTEWIEGVTSVNGQQGDLVLDKTSVGLGQVDNTSDLNKPVSIAQAAADTNSKNRSNHTGTQLAATISDLPTVIDEHVGTIKTNYLHTQSSSQTVWTINHNLGYDPAGIVITSVDGYMLDGYVVQYLTPGQSLRISFELSFAGTAVLS